VPGLFEALILERLFPDRTVRLVHGGVQDDQGVTTLLEQDCIVLLVSDASGQMASARDVSGGIATKVLGDTLGSILNVLLRTKDILMARVRESEYLDLDARRRSSLLRGLMFVHLTKDLGVPPVDWVRCDDPSRPPSTDLWTGYGVLKEVQRLLADIRTDLDSFTDVEAYALMTSGYRMTEADLEVTRIIEGVPEAGVSRSKPNWRFLTIESWMKAPSTDPKAPFQLLLTQLKIAGSVAFKVWRLRVGLQVFAAVLALVALGLVSFGVWTVLTTPEVRDQPLATFGQLVKGFLQILLMLLAALVLGKTVMAVVQYRKTLTRALVHLGMAIFGFLIARLHLHFFDRLYLRLGSITYRPTAFLCYAHGDEPFAGRLDEELRGSGLITAVDGRDTLFNPKREKEIQALIENSSTFVFIAGPGSIASTVCRALLTAAGSRANRILYVLTAGVTPADLPTQRPPGRVITVITNGVGTLDADSKRAILAEFGEMVV